MFAYGISLLYNIIYPLTPEYLTNTLVLHNSLYDHDTRGCTNNHVLKNVVLSLKCILFRASRKHSLLGGLNRPSAGVLFEIVLIYHTCFRCRKFLLQLFHQRLQSEKRSLLHAIVVNAIAAGLTAVSAARGRIHRARAQGISRQRVLYVNGVHEAWQQAEE